MTLFARKTGTRTVIQTVFRRRLGSGSGSYGDLLHPASATVSGSFGSGSGFSGSYAFGSCVYTAGGYGLELI